MTGKSKILVIGGTGHIGKHIVEASVRAGHTTFLLVRQTTLISKTVLIERFRSLGVQIIRGELHDHVTLVRAIKQVDVVISTVSSVMVTDQVRIIAAIKEAGNVKRFFPSEFGNDVDRCANAVEPASLMWARKAEIRRAIEAAGIPFTYVVSNLFAGQFLTSLSQHGGACSLPRRKVVILGDGVPKAVFVREEDIASYTIRSIDDPRTLNKILYIRPQANTLSFNELVTLWERKIGKTLERVYLSEEQVLANIRETGYPGNVVMAISHSVYVRGEQTNFEIQPSFGVEATMLYPDVNYMTVDEYLNQFV